jgi:hypothetical protein
MNDYPAFPGIIGSLGHGNTIAVHAPGFDSVIIDTQPGLSARALFAAMAMQGILANPGSVGVGVSVVAQRAVEDADALLAELAKGGTQ